MAHRRVAAAERLESRVIVAAGQALHRISRRPQRNFADAAKRLRSNENFGNGFVRQNTHCLVQDQRGLVQGFKRAESLAATLRFAP